MTTPTRGPGAPTPPIPLPADVDPAAVTGHLRTAAVDVPDAVIERLRASGAAVSTVVGDRVEASRDWWPLSMTWAAAGEIGAVAAVVVRPDDPAQVGEILAVGHEARIPITAAGGRSGVCGGSIPLYGGVVLDLCGLTGIRSVDDPSLVVDVLAGTFGDHFEADLRERHGLTCGHWPQSMALATVGGWLACRGAGQLSNRYGKAEDMVVGLDVALADGTVIATGGNARQASGPDLNQVFVGSEGTLGIITGARLRVHPAPTHERRAAYRFADFCAGLDACRRILRRGGTPAVLRLYDSVEARRNFQIDEGAVLLVLDEGDPFVIDAAMAIVERECMAPAAESGKMAPAAESGKMAPAAESGRADEGVEKADDSLVAHWLDHRNNVSQLQPLIEGGIVVDTFEITGSWGALPAIYAAAIDAVSNVEGTLAVSAHLSHSYTDGACLYFTFGGKVPLDQRDRYYRDVWDVGTRAVLERGGALSHHHGVGLNRARFMPEALGPAFGVLVSLKQALDPHGILNPGKLGLPHPFGANPFAGTVWVDG
jgi:alkyldihydroxyacetonephosphate synthase